MPAFAEARLRDERACFILCFGIVLASIFPVPQPQVHERYRRESYHWFASVVPAWFWASHSWAPSVISVHHSSIERAPKELKRLSKVDVEGGETKELTIELTERDLSYWNESAESWAVEPAEYRIHVGGSSEETPLEASTWLG